MNYFEKIYSGKTILVTGDSGFKGTWLCLWLKSLGADVIGYSKKALPGGINTATAMSSHIRHIDGDICNFDKLLKVFKEHKPEFVFHLAAQALVRYSYSHPQETYSTNVIGTMNVLCAAHETGSVRSFVNVTSDKCYQNNESLHAYSEDDAMGGYDPYSSSKGCSELLTASFRQSFCLSSKDSMALSSARAGNVIGGGDNSLDRLVPDCIKALVRNKTIILRNPLALRPWQHVLEPLSGYLLLAAKNFESSGLYSEGWNFGPGNDGVLNVRDIVDFVINEWGSGQMEVISDSEKHEACLLKLSIEKSCSRLQWKPVYSTQTCIKQTIEWYKFQNSHKTSPSDLLSFSQDQLQYYIDSAQAKGCLWAK